MEYHLDYARIGKRISEFRRAKKLSQFQLAELAEVTDSYISHIETGRKKPSLESLVRIASALGITLDRILLGNQVADLKDYLPEIRNLMKDCSPYEKAVILDMVKSLKSSMRKNGTFISRSGQEILKILTGGCCEI